MCGESSVAKDFTVELSKEGVMAGAIVFPMVLEIKLELEPKCHLD